MVGGLVEEVAFLVLKFVEIVGSEAEVVGLCTGVDNGCIGGLVGDETLGEGES